MQKYRSIVELPRGIKSLLPHNMKNEVKEKYLRAFNNSYNFYQLQMERNNQAAYEKMAHMVAWNVIKNLVPDPKLTSMLDKDKIRIR